MPQKKVEVEGTEYTLQHPGAYWYIECLDRCKNSQGVLQIAKYSKELLENVVVHPKVSFEKDFQYDAVTPSLIVAEVETFLNSKPDQPSKVTKEG